MDADFSGGRHLKVGRTYELGLFGPDEGGTMRLPGVDGTVSFPPGALEGEAVLLAGYELEPPPDDDGLMFLTPVLFITGTTRRLSVPARMSISIDAEGWSAVDRGRIGIYRSESGGWHRMKGG